MIKPPKDKVEILEVIPISSGIKIWCVFDRGKKTEYRELAVAFARVKRTMYDGDSFVCVEALINGEYEFAVAGELNNFSEYEVENGFMEVKK